MVTELRANLITNEYKIEYGDILIGKIEYVENKWRVLYYEPVFSEITSSFEYAEKQIAEFENYRDVIDFSISYFNVLSIVIIPTFTF